MYVLKGRNVIVLTLLVWLISHSLFAQKGIITAGFQFKPIFNNDFFGAGAQSAVKGVPK